MSTLCDLPSIKYSSCQTFPLKLQKFAPNFLQGKCFLGTRFPGSQVPSENPALLIKVEPWLSYIKSKLNKFLHLTWNNPTQAVLRLVQLIPKWILSWRNSIFCRGVTKLSSDFAKKSGSSLKFVFFLIYTTKVRCFQLQGLNMMDMWPIAKKEFSILKSICWTYRVNYIDKPWVHVHAGLRVFFEIRFSNHQPTNTPTHTPRESIKLG